MSREQDQAAGGFVGRNFLTPVAFALAILLSWVMLAQMVTPGVSGLGEYGEDQRLLRWLLIGFGLIVDGIGVLVVLFRLNFQTEITFEAEAQAEVEQVEE